MRTKANTITNQVVSEATREHSEHIWDYHKSNREESKRSIEVEDLDYLSGHPRAHLTPVVARYIVLQSRREVGTDIVLRHLRSCQWCRNMLLDTLDICAVPATHIGYLLVAEAEEWAVWAAAGARATHYVRKLLHESGGRVIFECDGVVCEELPDGSIRSL